MNRIATIILLASLCLVAPAHAKRCRALCASQIATCRSECREAPRRERRRCRTTCIGSVLAACRQLADPACVAPSNDGPADPPPTTDDDPSHGGDGGACGPASTCEDLAQYALGWQPGVSATPADFPPPPPGAVVCGSDSAGITHYLYSGSMDAVVAYYRQQLEARSMSFSGPNAGYGRPGCDEIYLYSRPGQIVPDQLYVFVHEGHFTLTGFTAQ